MEQLAWEIYCRETAGGMDVRDFIWELSSDVYDLYMEKAKKYMRKFQNNS